MIMSKFIDCHAHLCDNEFTADLPDVIERARNSGVCGILVVSIGPGDFENILHLHQRYPGFCWPCFGVHPIQHLPQGEYRVVTNKDLEEGLPWIHEHHDKLFAIGEVGLDFTPRFCVDENAKDMQRYALQKQVELAKQYDLPLNIHSRSAGRPMIHFLKEHKAEKVLLHAFDGRAAVAMEGVQQGYYFSIPPSIVRSQQKQKLVERIPLENMLLETDSPALGPEKQQRNEPSNIRLSCEYIAKIKKTDIETVANILWENSLRLFPKIRHFLK